MRSRPALLLLTLLSPSVIAQQPPHTSANSPAGSWIAEHKPNEPLQLWWIIQPNGTLTAFAGAVARSHYTLVGDTLTIAPTAADPSAGSFTVRWESGKLYLTAHADRSPTLEYTRLSPPPPNAPPNSIVGAWRVSSAPHASDPQEEALRNIFLRSVTVYRANGSYESRVPFRILPGTWNAAAGTYTLQGEKPLPLHRTGPNLTIALPPAGKEQRLYHPDPFPETN